VKGRTPVIRPKFELEKFPLGKPKFVWFKMLKKSIRTLSDELSVNLVTFAKVASAFQRPGPVTKPRGVFPSVPSALSVNEAGSNQ
jgi:hypothetical protein